MSDAKNDDDEITLWRCVHKTKIVVYKPTGQEKVYEDVLSLSLAIQDGEPLIFEFRTQAGYIERITTNLPYVVIESKS